MKYFPARLRRAAEGGDGGSAPVTPFRAGAKLPRDDCSRRLHPVNNFE